MQLNACAWRMTKDTPALLPVTSCLSLRHGAKQVGRDTGGLRTRPHLARRPDCRGSTVAPALHRPSRPSTCLLAGECTAWRGSLGPAALSTAVCAGPLSLRPDVAARPQEASGPRPSLESGQPPAASPPQWEHGLHTSASSL